MNDEIPLQEAYEILPEHNNTTYYVIIYRPFLKCISGFASPELAREAALAFIKENDFQAFLNDYESRCAS